MGCAGRASVDGRCDFDAALTAWFRGDYKTAIERYSLYIDAYPNSAGAISNRGSIYLGMGLISLAIADLERSVELAGSFNAADRDLALAYHLAGRDHEALSMINQAIAANRYDCRSFRIRAQIYECLGRRESAIADYREVLELKGITEEVKIAQEALGRLGSE